MRGETKEPGWEARYMVRTKAEAMLRKRTGCQPGRVVRPRDKDQPATGRAVKTRAADHRWISPATDQARPPAGVVGKRPLRISPPAAATSSTRAAALREGSRSVRP